MGKIAVDVKGTLHGYRRKQILFLLEKFLARGFDVTVWSSLSSYAYEEARELNRGFIVPYQFDKKYSMTDAESSVEDGYIDGLPIFDLAIEDDRSQDYLAARNFLWVDEIPSEEAELYELLKVLTKKIEST